MRTGSVFLTARLLCLRVVSHYASLSSSDEPEPEPGLHRWMSSCSCRHDQCGGRVQNQNVRGQVPTSECIREHSSSVSRIQVLCYLHLKISGLFLVCLLPDRKFYIWHCWKTISWYGSCCEFRLSVYCRGIPFSLTAAFIIMYDSMMSGKYLYVIQSYLHQRTSVCQSPLQLNLLHHWNNTFFQFLYVQHTQTHTWTWTCGLKISCFPERDGSLSRRLQSSALDQRHKTERQKIRNET